MDAITHTIIATVMLYVSYQVGKWFGNKEGEDHVWNIIGSVFNAKKIEINEDEEFIVTDIDGKSRKVN